MKSLLFIILAGYAVRSDSINEYYVIEMPDDPPIRLQTKKPFKVYWNVPTMQCSSKKIYFDNLFEDFGIIQNDNDRFKGEKVTILYDPGLFPALFKNETSGNFRLRNGGVPQEGDLDEHLEEFSKELDQSIPDKNFSGVGIIDFESWRPIFRQNFGQLQPYKDFSIEIEKKLHWWWQKSWIQAEAKRRFEEAARAFMQSTLSVAKQLRPRAAWGFYGFPYCFNMASNNMAESCANNVSNENDQINWLWSDSTALFPSVYSSAKLSTTQLVSLIRGRVKEAARCAKNGGKKKDILPYIWFRYRDGGFLSQTDLAQALSTLYKSEATGMMIWGSSNDVNTVAKCTNLLTYVQTILGPAIAKYTIPPNRLSDVDIDSSTTTTTTETHVSIETTNITPDPANNWNLAENYTENKTQNVTKDPGYTASQNNSVLIDLILNSNTVLNTIGTTISTDNPNHSTSTHFEPLYVDTVSSTTELNVNVTSTETSQAISSLITDSIQISSSSTEIDLKPEEESSRETTSTEKGKVVEQITDKYESVDSIQALETDSVIKTTTTQVNIDTAKENETDSSLKANEEIAFTNSEMLKNETRTISADYSTDVTMYKSNIRKNEKKNIVTTNVTNADVETTMKYDAVRVNETITTESDKITKLLAKSIINEYSDDFTSENEESNESSTLITTPVSLELFSHSTNEIPSVLTSTYIETSTHKLEMNEENSSHSSTISTTISDLSNDTELANLQELEMTNVTNVDASSYVNTVTESAKSSTVDRTTESDAPKNLEALKTSTEGSDLQSITPKETSTSLSEDTGTFGPEETSTLVPTSPTQVSGSATRFKRSYLYYILFCVYTLSTCVF